MNCFLIYPAENIAFTLIFIYPNKLLYEPVFYRANWLSSKLFFECILLILSCVKLKLLSWYSVVFLVIYSIMADIMCIPEPLAIFIPFYKLFRIVVFFVKRCIVMLNSDFCLRLKIVCTYCLATFTLLTLKIYCLCNIIAYYF